MRSASWQSFGRSAGGAGYGCPSVRYRSRRARRGTPARARIRSIVRGSGSSRSRSLLSSQRIAVAPTWAHGFAWSRRRTARMSASSFGALRLALCLGARERSRAQPSSFGSYRASHFTTQRRLRRSSRATALALSPASTRRTASRRSFSSTSTIPVTSLDVRVEEERQRSGRSRVIESVDRSETQHEHDVLSVVRERCPDGCQLALGVGLHRLRDGGEELLVRLGLAEPLQQELGAFDLTHGREHLAQEDDLLHDLGRQQHLLAARARRWDVDRRERAALLELAVEDHLGVAGALELFVDDVVHARAGIYQAGREDRERTAALDVARGAEETLRRVERDWVHTTGERAA